MKRTAYKVLMWWCIALAVAGAVILAMGNTWGILQIVVCAGIAYSAYRKVKDIEIQQSNEELPDASYTFPDEVDLSDGEYLKKINLSDEFREAIGLKGPIYEKKKGGKKK